MAVSGGSTPKRLYQILAEPAYQARIPWKDVHWFWGDERMVPRADPLSNYRMTSEALLSHVPVPPENVTPEGLRIQIIDEKNRPMFDTSSAELKPYTKVILREIGRALNAVPNKVSFAGHTDAAQFGGGEKGFSNWELSANRANASRREMVMGGMDENKVLRVVGQSSTVLFDKNDPLSSANRRINIVVLNKRTEEAMLQEDGNATVDLGDAAGVAGKSGATN